MDEAKKANRELPAGDEGLELGVRLPPGNLAGRVGVVSGEPAGWSWLSDIEGLRHGNPRSRGLFAGFFLSPVYDISTLVGSGPGLSSGGSVKVRDWRRGDRCLVGEPLSGRLVNK
jgi:hypothetical protein